MDDQRVILVGIDGATWNLLGPWVKQKKLPAFAKLMNNGVHGKLESNIPPLSPPAWTSIFTGVNPGKHNIFGFVKRKENSYFVTPIISSDRKAVPIWNTFTDHGKRCILLNIPFSYPPDKVNGIMTTGLGTPSKNSEFVHPKDFKNTILKKFPSYDVDFNEDLILLRSNIDPVKQIEKITDAQIELTKYLFKKEKWDFLSVVFRSLDVVQHYYWKDKKVLLDCYLQMDRFLGWLTSKIDEKTFLLICSDHGFSGIHTSVNMNNWLQKNNFLKMKERKKGKIKKVLPSAEKIQVLLLKLGLRKLVNRVKKSKIVEPIIKHLLSSDRVQYIFDVEWAKVKVYFLDGSFGMMNVNLKGREPEGLIGKNEYEKVRTECTSAILKLRDPVNGARIIKKVYRGEELYNGRSKNIPDIVLEVNEGYNLVSSYDYGGKIFTKEKIRFGEHARFGIFMAYGPGIKKGTIIDNARIYDMVPTVLQVFDIPISSDIDGKILKGIYDEKTLFLKTKGATKSHFGKAEPKKEGDAVNSTDERSKIDDHIGKLFRKGII